MRDYTGTIYFPSGYTVMDKTLITFIGQNFKWDKGSKISGWGTLLYRTEIDGTQKQMVIQGMFIESVPHGECAIVFPNNTQAIGHFQQGQPCGKFTYECNEGGKKWTAEITFVLNSKYGNGTKTTDDEKIVGMFDFQGREEGKAKIFDKTGKEIGTRQYQHGISVGEDIVDPIIERTRILDSKWVFTGYVK